MLYPQQHLVPIIQEVVDFKTVVQERLVPGIGRQPEVILGSGEDEEFPNISSPARHDSEERERERGMGNLEKNKITVAEESKLIQHSFAQTPSRPAGPQSFAVAKGSRYGDNALLQKPGATQQTSLYCACARRAQEALDRLGVL